MTFHEQCLAKLYEVEDSIGELTPHASRVALFAIKGGQEIPLCPTVPSRDVLRLRCLLLLEEALEFVEASGFGVTLYNEEIHEKSKLGERFGMTLRVEGEPFYEGMVDACADVSVVNTGTLLALGAGDVEVLEKVDAANLAKVEEGAIRDSNGKIMKPFGWTPPVYRCVDEYETLKSMANNRPESKQGGEFGEGILVASSSEVEVNLQ